MGRWEEQAERVRQIQQKAGWSEESTRLYLEDLKERYCDERTTEYELSRNI